MRKHEPRKLCLFSHIPCLENANALACYIFDNRQPLLIFFALISYGVRAIINRFNFSYLLATTSFAARLRRRKWPNFFHHRLFVNRPITNEDKFLIKSLFTLECYNAKQFVWEFTEKARIYATSTSYCRSHGLMDRSSWQQQTTQSLHRSSLQTGVYTKMARR